MSWLLQFCAARAAFATLFTAWSAVLPLLRGDWQMSAWQAGMVQSGYHVGFLVSLFAVGFERINAEAEAVVQRATDFADASPEPALDTLYDHVYATPVANMQIGGSLIKPPTLSGAAANN